jgi:hypothetical protein
MGCKEFLAFPAFLSSLFLALDFMVVVSGSSLSRTDKHGTAMSRMHAIRFIRRIALPRFSQAS